MRIYNSGQNDMEANHISTVAKKQEKSNVTVKGRTISINAGKMESDPIAARRKLAHKQAMKLIKDAFKGQQSNLDKIKELEKLAGEFEKECSVYRDNIIDADQRMDGLKESYGISEDSEEQKNLELLVRAKEDPFSLSAEERKQVDAIREQGLTEYQSKYLTILDEKNSYKRELDRQEGNIGAIYSSINTMRLAMLKDHSMYKASKEAENIEKKAAKDAATALIEEGKDNIDEDFEELKEKAQKVKEKRIAEEEKELKAEEREARIEEMIERIRESNEEDSDYKEEHDRRELSVDAILANKDILSVPNFAAVESEKASMSAEVKTIAAKLKLIDDDIKGAAVDKTL